MTTLRSDEVDVTPLREAFLASGVSAAEVAERLGWYRSNGAPDSTRVRKKLGLTPVYNFGRREFQHSMRYETATVVCRAIGAWPVDVGI